MKHMTFDIETSYGTFNGRVGSPWSNDCKLCALGWNISGYQGVYYVVKSEPNTEESFNSGVPANGAWFPDISNVDILVGHNIKFDLLWFWDNPEVQEFIRRGGKIWDTMYAEYLLSGQFYIGKDLSLKACCERRKLQVQKLDIVKALWEDGIRTEDIPEQVLMEYLKHDVLSTNELYLIQLEQAKKQDQLVMIEQRMEGLIATTDIEMNGMFVDREVAAEQQRGLEDKIKVLTDNLNKYIPKLPEGCEFKWSSWRNVSALIFGGDLKYIVPAVALCVQGNKKYFTKKIKVPVMEGGEVVKYKSGKRVGEIKYKVETVPDYERGPKTKLTGFTFTLPRLSTPKEKWASSVPGYYSTSEEVLNEIKDAPLVNDLLDLKKYEKDLGTYYYKERPNGATGMLSNIQDDGFVHGHLNHSITVTGRLSSSKPNLQNIPKKGKSEIKKVFSSRFPEGVVAEIDYSQLEVVTKAVLSGDKALLKALKDNVDFHCDWLSLATGVPYEEVYHQVKVIEDPIWIGKRTAIKPVTFGQAYGAGISTLCESSGLPADIIKRALDSHKLKYPKMYAFDDSVMQSVNRTRQRTHLRTDAGYTRGVGFYRSVTDTIYSFVEDEAPSWLNEKGVHTAFSPTCVKNYPSQGLGGEIMQVQLGRLIRLLYRSRIQDSIKIFNTVHDSCYIDFRTEDVALKYLPKICSLLEDVSPYFNKVYRNVHWNTPFPVDAQYGKNIYETKHNIKERDNEWIL